MNVGIVDADDTLIIPPFDNCLAGLTATRLLELVAENVRRGGELACGGAGGGGGGRGGERCAAAALAPLPLHLAPARRAFGMTSHQTNHHLSPD